MAEEPKDPEPVYETKFRYIPIGSDSQGQNTTEYCTNYIRTTKYTLYNFLPFNLFEQFQKPANFYFLIIAILSALPFSPKTPLVSVIPLVFVLTVTAFKEGVEDYNRFKSDVEINNKSVQSYRDNQWTEITWTDVKVGDILRVVDNQPFPADLLLLQSSAQSGICNIETSNLDGETNLKIKQAIPETYEIKCSSDGLDYPKHLRGVVESEGPNEKMDKNSWKGTLTGLNAQNTQPLTFSSLLLRGCVLKNTKWIIALVVFTGRETKLMMQNKGEKLKRSKVERTVDKALIVIFTIQGAVCIFGAVAYSIWMNMNATNHWYLPYVIDNINLAEEATVSFFTYLVLVDLLVPISLYVSMELVKATQAYYINQDLEMYYDVNDLPARARTSNLNEELGQVEYIFSDKTGTLTRNQMEFLRCSIAGIPYGPGEEDRSGEHPNRLPPQKDIPELSGNFRFADNRLINNLRNNHETAKDIDEFLTLLSVCHTVVPEYPECEDKDHIHATTCKTKVKYQAASPDELALVLAATELQYFFHHREPVKFNLKGLAEINGQRVKVNILGQQHDFSILEILEFNSTRKRMSIIILDPRDKKIKIYCKGADNVIRERCNKKSLAARWKVTEKQLQDFAVEGLRTLCCGYRTISKKEFQQWFEVHNKAKASMDNREAEINASSAMIEKDFELIGATAIEDRLQDGVPEAIAKLAQAGIKIWVCTGDKVETAINIGRSCRLLTPRMRGKNLLVIDIEESLDDGPARIETHEALEHHSNYLKERNEEEKNHVAIVVSGKALGYIFPIRKLDKNKKEIPPTEQQKKEEQELQNRFLSICTQCKAVICCRMSPKQKSQVVKLVRDNTPAITLAIGDGANDVAMIEAAHVGIGIEGLEGKQAVMASDYSIGQFRYLLRLLLIHGGWSYKRLSLLILYSFYKNVTISMIGIWFAFYSSFSAQVYIDAISGASYNMIFTAFPVMLAAIFNRDISADNLIRYPELYKVGISDERFNLRVLFLNIFQGFCHSVVLYFFSIFTFDLTTKTDGSDNDLWIMSAATYTCLVLLVNYRIALLTTTWVRPSFWLFFFSIGIWFVWGFAYSAVLTVNPDHYWVFYRLCSMANFWFLILMAPIACLLPDLTYDFVRKTYRFTKTDIIQERQAGYKPGPDFNTVDDHSKIIDVKPQNSSSTVNMSDRKMTSSATAASVASAANAEPERKNNWAKVAQKVKGDHLGFVPFIEDETGDAFVMGQKAFLERYLVVRNRAPVSIQHADDMKSKQNNNNNNNDQFEEKA